MGVTKEEAIKRQQADAEKQKPLDEKQKQIQNQINQSGRGAGNQLRGYNYSSYNPQTGEIKGNNPQSGEYQYNPQTNQMQGNIPNNQRQNIESQEIRTQLEARDLEKQIKDLEASKEKADADWAKKDLNQLSRADKIRGNTTSATLASEISRLKAEKQAIQSRPDERNAYSGVMATSGKIYASESEAKKQGATLAKTRSGETVRFEGDIRATAGYGQSGRGYNYQDITDKNIAHGSSPQTGDWLVNKKTGVKEGNVPTEIATAFPWAGQETGKVRVQEDYSKNFVTGEDAKSDTGFPKVTNDKTIYNRTGSGTASDPFRSNQPEEKQLAGFADPVWLVGDKTFETKKEADLFIDSQTEQQKSYWTIPDAQGNAIKNKRGSELRFKSQESAQKYMDREGIGISYTYDEPLGLSKEDKPYQGPIKGESVYLPVGTLQYQYGQQPESPFKKGIETQFNVLTDLQQTTTKKAESGKPLDILQQIGYGVSELERSGLAFAGTIINLTEEHVDPYVERTLGLKPSIKTSPIYFKGETASQVQLSYDLSLTPEQNKKKWASQQAAYIKKQGLPSYLLGGLENYYMIRSAGGAARIGLNVLGKNVVRLATPSLAKGARSAAIEGIPTALKSERGFASPSKSWDVAEKITPTGMTQRNRPNIIPLKPVTSEKPVPNPFGKERRIPYAIEQGAKKIKGLIEELPDTVSSNVPPEVSAFARKVAVSGSMIATKTKTGLRSSVDTFNEWNKQPSQIPEGYTRKGRTLERMRNIMYPEEPILPQKKSTSPPIGYKTRLSAEMYARTTKKNVKENTKVLTEGIRKIGGKIKSEGGYNFSLGSGHLGKKSQLPELNGMKTPEALVKFKRKADVSLLATKQKIKTSIFEVKKTTGKMRDVLYPEEPKKTLIPFKTKQELKNITREDQANDLSDFFSKAKARQRTPNLRAEFVIPKRREYVTPLKKETTVEKMQRKQKENLESRKNLINLPERTVIPRLKYKETRLIDRILSGLEKPSEPTGEYMPRSKGKSKPNRNIFIEDKADKTSDFFSKAKARPDLRKEFPKTKETVPGLSKKYFEKKSVTSKARTLNLKEEFKLKQEKETPIEKLKGEEPKGIREFVKEGEKRRSFVERLRKEKKLELPERNVSIFKVPYKETDLDKMLAALGKKQKNYFKKSTYETEKTPSQKDFEGEPLKKRWRDETRKDVGRGKQILITEPPKTKTKLDQPETKIKDVVESGKDGDKDKPSQIIVPPMPKEEKRKKPETQTAYVTFDVPLHKDRPQITARTLTARSLSLGTRAGLSSIAGISVRQATPQRIRSDVKISQSLSTPQKTKSIEVTKEKFRLSEKLEQPQKQRSRQKTKSPEIWPRPTAQTPALTPKQKPRQILRTPEVFIFPPEVKPLPFIIDKKNKTKRPGKKSRKSEDFLGNSLTYDIQGLLRREDVIYGDKKTDRQVKKDRKAMFNPKGGLGFSNKKKLRL